MHGYWKAIRSRLLRDFEEFHKKVRFWGGLLIALVLLALPDYKPAWEGLTQRLYVVGSFLSLLIVVALKKALEDEQEDTHNLYIREGDERTKVRDELARTKRELESEKASRIQEIDRLQSVLALEKTSHAREIERLKAELEQARGTVAQKQADQLERLTQIQEKAMTLRLSVEKTFVASLVNPVYQQVLTDLRVFLQEHFPTQVVKMFMKPNRSYAYEGGRDRSEMMVHLDYLVEEMQRNASST